MTGSVQDVAFLTFAWGSLVPMAIAVRRSAPGARTPWLLLFAALAVGDVLATLRRLPEIPEGLAQVIPVFSSVANVLMLACAIAVVARRGRNDIGGLIDTTIVSLALGGLLWSVLLLPHLEAAERTFASKATIFITVMALCGALGALVRLIETDTQHLRVLRFLLGALALHLLSCVVLALWSSPAASTTARMMFMTAYLTLGVFAVDPSAAQLVQPGVPPRDALGPGRLVFLGAALAAVPVVASTRVLIGFDVDALFLAISSAAMAPLVMLRIGLLAAQRRRSEQALRYLAAHDPLTGVLNRREFTERLGEHLRSGAGCVLVFCDLDGFKTVNDRLGHPAGDRILVEVAQRLQACLRAQDLVGRFGGDEFLLLFRGASEAEAPTLCDRIRAAIGRPFSIDVGELAISVGAVSSEAIGREPGRQEHGMVEELIRRADDAMYASKQPRLDMPPFPAGIV